MLSAALITCVVVSHTTAIVTSSVALQSPHRWVEHDRRLSNISRFSRLASSGRC